MSQINLQQGTTTVESSKTKKKKRICSEVSVKSESVRKKTRYATVGKIFRKREVLSLEWKNEGVMDDEVVS